MDKKGGRDKRRIIGRSGFTLMEIIIALSLLGMVMAAAGGFIKFSFTAEKKVEDEYELQSEMRHATEILNNAVRDASVTFIMPGDAEEAYLKDKWSYIGVSEDKREFVQYLWVPNEDGKGGSHVKRVLVSAKNGVTYSLRFDNTEDTKLVDYTIGLDKVNGKSMEVASTVSAINSVAVDLYSSERNPASLIAYREDPRPQPEGNKNVTVVISMVLDDSGSMKDAMGGGSPGRNEKSRSQIMKDKANALIDSFPENVWLGVVRFADNANNPSSLIHLVDERKKEEAKRKIPTSANGGTNTGDGLRRGYYQLQSYSKAADEEVLYYIILLTDGDPTYYSYVSGGSSYDNKRTNLVYQKAEGNIKNRGGSGSTDRYDTCIDYTKYIGDELLIKDTGLKPKTFVIGFSGVPSEVSRAKIIAKNCNPAGTNLNEIYFDATDETSLGIAFDAIKETILLELWHIYGPYGKPEN
ncbi:MAG: VWA domain-containing protein [Anaerovoracaceae bacterium]|jgi:prepilin-type N-terminal cleavage/methylation domain-containing protein